MDGLRISEAARATGFSVSALRFYEQERVVIPDRTRSGYRSYGPKHVEALRFIARGKQLGLSLEDIAQLLVLLDEEECEPVQSRIRHLVGERISQAQEQIAELVAFTAQLQNTAARLGVHTPSGACDEACGCRSQPEATAPNRDLVPLAVGDNGIACSLGPGLVGDRIEDWQRVLAVATHRTATPGGIRVGFDTTVDVGELAELVAAEQGCCSFFTFRIAIGADGVSLEVTGPEDAQPVIAALFGAAA